MYSKKQLRTMQAAICGAQEVIRLVGDGGNGLLFEEDSVSDIFFALNDAWLDFQFKIEEEDRPNV